MSTDLGNLNLGLSFTGNAVLDMVESRLAAMDRASYVARLGVDTGAVTVAQREVASLSTAHQALNKTSTLGMDYSQITSARTAVQGLDGDIGAMATSLSKLAAPAALAGIGLGVTKLAADFQTMTTNIRNNTTETDADFAAMTSSVKDMAAQSGASLDSLANGYMHAFNLTGSATQATNDLSIAMKSAVSTGGDVSATTDALAKTMHQFGVESGGAAVTMDTLHASAALGNTTLQQFVDSSAKSMVTAASLGISLKDVSSAYVGLTRSGFDAGEANTQLAALMTHLINPTAAAKKEIAALSASTGIDLVSDFSLAGVQSKGLISVLGDLRTATGGQEDAVLKLIPAQRGGIGALALTTSAYKDVLDAGTQLARVQDGEWTPTADAYARTQETLGFKVGVLGQQFKQLGIDAGNATIGPLTAVLGVVASIPEGVDKAAIGFGIAALAVKTLSTASDLLVAGTAKVGAAMVGETASVTADTAAWTANAAARNAAAGMTGIEGYGARTAASQVGTDAVGLAGYEARTAAQAGTSVAGSIGTGLAGIGAGIGTAAIPVAIPVALGYVIGSQIVDPIFAGIEAQRVKIEQTKITATIETTIRYAQSADSRDQGRADLEKQLVDAKAMQQQFQDLADKGFNPGGDQAQKAVDFFKAQQQTIQQALTDTSPQHYATQATDEFAKHLTDLSDAVDTNRLTLEQATKFADDYRNQAIATGEGVNQATEAEKAWALALTNSANAARDKLYVDYQTQQAERDKARTLLSEGAPANVVENAVFGKGFGADPTVVIEAQAELAVWQKSYDAQQASAKANDAAQLASAKQRITDEATADKAALTQKTADQTAAATAVEQAWNAASSAITGLDKHLDGTAAISTLSGMSDQLHTTEDALARLGQDSPHLDALVGLSDIFKGITDQTDKANAALDGYNLTLSNTNKAIQAIGSLKSEYMAALDAAQKRVANGTADASDLAIIAARTNVLATLDRQTSGLQQAGNQDILGKLANLPNYTALDASGRQAIAANGGAQNILLNITTNADAAQQEIRDKLLQAKQTQIDIKTNATEVQTQIDNIAKARTADLTIVTHFVDDQGRPTVNPTLDPTRGYGEPQSGSGVPNQLGAPPTGGGALGFASLSLDQYNQIVPGSSPLHNSDSYAALITASKAQNIDPRLLLTLAQQESSYGTSGLATNARADGGRNDVGLTYSGAFAGEYKDPNVANSQGQFASFHTDAEMFAAAAKNLQMGPYADAFKSGDAAALFKTWDGTGTMKADIYNALRSQYPDQTGYSTTVNNQTGIGAPITRAQGYGPGDTGLGSGQTPTGGLASDAIAGSVRDQIVQKALSQVDQNKLVDYCEQFVEETVQAVTGKRGATGVNQNSATEAFNAAQSQGLVRPANQAPQAGDLVYYPGASASDPGHVAIYVGNGQQVSTYDKGAFPGNSGPDHGSGTDAANAKIHIESISPGARFVMVPGTESDTTNRSNTPDVQQGFAPLPGSVPPNINATASGTPTPPPIPPDFTKAAEDLSVALAKLDPAALKDAASQFSTMVPIFQAQQEKAKEINGDPNSLTPTDKQNALNAATQQGLEYEAKYAQLVYDVENHTGSILTDTQAISSVVGGPMAAGFGAAALASAQLAASQDAITKLQEQQKIADAAQQVVTRQRTAADQADARLQTIISWGQQFLQNQLANKTTAENTAYTQIQRDEQDRQRALQFQQQLQATGLQNSLTDLQKQQQSTIYNRTSQEQLQAATVKGAGTNEQAAAAAAVLATMHDQDLAQKDLNTKAIDNIQLQIREQAKQSNLESYNLQTETITAQRKHENIMQGFTAEGTALSRQQQEQARAHTISQWRIQDTRQAEDAKYQAAKDANTKEQEAQTVIGKAAQANLDLANQALLVWQQTGAVFSVAAQQIPSLMQAVYNAQTAGLSTANGVPYSQFPAPGQSHATGGSVSGWGIVGDSPGGDMSNAEAVYGTYTVIPHNQSVRAGLISGASGGSTAPSMTVNLNLGDIGLMLSDADKAEINQLITTKLNAARKAGINQMRAVGR